MGAVRVRLPLSAMKILPPARPVSTPLYHLLLLGEERGDTRWIDPPFSPRQLAGRDVLSGDNDFRQGSMQ